MSLGARATKGGAKAGKDGKPQDKGKTDKPQPKEKVKPQATTEQLRMAHMIDRKSEDASDVRRMVLELMETTCRTEEEVCSALHDSDNDIMAACNLLLEDKHTIQGVWKTNEKKKKKPPAAAGNGEAEPPRELDARSRSGPRPRRGEGEGGRGGRGGGRGGRGGARVSRGGRRAPPPRARGGRPGWGADNDQGGTTGDSFPATEDWDNEEWSGSLSDTKVFTPSTTAQAASDHDPGRNLNSTMEECWDTPEANGSGEAHVPYTYPTELPTHTPHNTHASHASHATHASHAAQPPHLKLIEQMSTANNLAHAEPAPLDSYRPTTHHQPMGMSGSLSAAQSQYLSQLTAGSSSLPAAIPAASQPQPQSQPGYPYADTAQRKPQRARVPPPSKIPSLAVEMPGGGGEGSMFLDVQFGALEPDTLQDTPSTKQVPSQPEPVPAAAHTHETSAEVPNTTAYANTNNNTMLNESLSVVDTTPTSQPVTTESIVTNSTTSLEKQLSAGMKQLSVLGVSATEPAAAPPPAGLHYTQHHRPKQTVGQQQNLYAHHAVSHHPPVYGANVYAPQVNSTNASLTGASAMSGTAYPSSVTLTQYQPIINSYQQTSSSATVYGGAALYTAAPYTAYTPTPQPKLQPKDTTQYDSSVASSNSLTSTSTTQTSTAKVATTTVTAAGAGTTGATGAGAGYAAGTLYGAAGSATYAAYDEAQMMRSTLPHHMGGYYEVGYGGREGTFGLGAGERFGRADAASPQQVPAALPPGYAYFYQPPPTTYQYGVYPTYGGGSNVGGVGGVSGGGGGKLNTYAPQQPPYDAQDTYKPGGLYTGNASKSAAAAADLTTAMYAKTHVALNKVNSYEKATFHSGTPPPFGAGSHLYIPAPPHHHHNPHHHNPTPQHQMDARVNSSHRRESGGTGGRAAASKPAASKPTYSQSYWAPN